MSERVSLWKEKKCKNTFAKLAWCTGPIPILNEYHPFQNQSRLLIFHCFQIYIFVELCDKYNKFKHFVCCWAFLQGSTHKCNYVFTSIGGNNSWHIFKIWRTWSGKSAHSWYVHVYCLRHRQMLLVTNASYQSFQWFLFRLPQVTVC